MTPAVARAHCFVSRVRVMVARCDRRWAHRAVPVVERLRRVLDGRQGRDGQATTGALGAQAEPRLELPEVAAATAPEPALVHLP